jgi:hypothetical protein
VASEKQIAANRRNAQRSTGPRSAVGKSLSSRNAFRHGLSLPSDDDVAARAAIERLVQTIVKKEPMAANMTDVEEWVTAQWDLCRVEQVKRALLVDVDLSTAEPKQLQKILATDRYARRAQTRRRRAALKLKDACG